MAYIPSSGSVVAFQGNPSVLQAVVKVSNPGDYSGSVVAFQGSAPWANTNVGSVITVGQGSIAVNIIAGSVAVATGNSSVQVLNFPTNQSVSGSVGIEGTPTFLQLAGSILATSATITPAANQSVSGTVQAQLQSTNASVITVGTAAANQSVSGTVDAAQISTWRVSVISSAPSSMLVGASIIGLTPVAVSNFPTNQNISGSVVAFQGTPEWTVKSSIAGGIFPVSGSVAAVVTNFPTTQNISGSVVAWITNSTNSSIITVEKSSSIIAINAGSVVAISQGSVITVAQGSVASAIINTPQASVHGTVKVFPASVVTGHGSVNGVASVQVLAAAGSGLHNYITDFTLSNTGATTTLVTFTDGDGSIMGKSIAPAGGGAIATGLIAPMRTLQTNKVVNIVAATATSVLHAWIGGYKAP